MSCASRFQDVHRVISNGMRYRLAVTLIFAIALANVLLARQLVVMAEVRISLADHPGVRDWLLAERLMFMLLVASALCPVVVSIRFMSYARYSTRCHHNQLSKEKLDDQKR